MERRTFLSRLVSLFSVAVAGMFSLPVLRFGKATLADREEGAWYTLLKTNSQVLTDVVTQVRFNRILRDGWMTRVVEDVVWVRKKDDGSFLVFEPHCTHLGCAYAWNAEAKQFQCPCHGGKFDADGNRISGPPPRPLDRFETKISDNMLRIGKLIKTDA